MERLWKICTCLLDDTGGLSFVEWDINISLYNPCSGDTHLFNLFPLEILHFLLLKPASLSAIADYMAVLCEEDNNKHWNNKILHTLMQLKEFELIDYQN